MNDYNFKPFDKVLVRDGDACEWTCNLFSHKTENLYVCMDASYQYCIPYEGNEHLLGTTDSPQPKRWRAKKREQYWFISSCEVCLDQECEEVYDDKRYNIGNYFRTKEEAQAMADKFKEMLKGDNQ